MFSAVVAVHAVYDGIEQRSQARALQYQKAYPARKPVALVVDSFDTVKGVQHSVVFVRPLSADAPLPPGVERWPAPGEVVASPGLVRALESEHAPGRFGRIVGEIRNSGLASPGERFAYVNPTEVQLRRARVEPIVGFGWPGQGMPGDLLFIGERAGLLNALCLVLVPVLVLAVLAVRMGASARDKRTALISALGGGWRARLWLHWGEAGPPVLAGALLGTLPGLIVATTGDVRLPWVDYWLSSADLRRSFWELLGMGGVAAAFVLALVGVMHRAVSRRRSVSTRVTARRSKVVHWGALACPILLFVTVTVPAQLDPAEHTQLRANLYNIGIGLVLVTLPCVVALGAAAVGRGLAAATRRTGSGGALVSGRHTESHPGVTARLVAGVAVALVVVTQVQLNSLHFGSSAAAARRTAAQIGQSLLVMDFRPEKVDKGQMEDLLRRLPPGTEVLAVRPADSPAAATSLQGSCNALRSVHVQCSGAALRVDVRAVDRRIAEAIRWTGPRPDHLEVKVGPVLTDNLLEGPRTVFLTSSDGKNLPVVAIKQLVRDHLSINAAQVGVPGESWLEGSKLTENHGRWVAFFGVPGILVLALAVALVNLAEFLRFGNSMAPLSVLTGQRRLYYSASVFSLLLPLIAAIAVGLVAAQWLAAPQEVPAEGIVLPMSVVWSAAGALVALSAVTSWWGARAAIRQAARWRPYGA
ncbi:hypothetical protein [Streptomyces mashuensis]|uniref:hypothetical protein n=1 Tax=Streptomyces mashuensis TaxID=33904 RepID=UPI00167F0983|nr:hypothetical protein [Streptomyces mashuensis]